MDFAQLQAEVSTWSDYNFPDNTPDHPLKGIGEELGELYESTVKYFNLEVWRDIPGYEGIYQISDIGRIKRIKGGQGAVPNTILSPAENKDGYLGTYLYSGTVSSKKWFAVHQLVAMAFIGPCPEGFEVNHKNGNKQHNFSYNLEYVTHQDNIKFAVSLSGSWAPRGLNMNQLQEIKVHIENGLTNIEISRMYNTDSSTISRIRSGEIYKENQILSDTSLRLIGKALGELLHANLKYQQKIRGITYEEYIEKAEDALADMLIYMADFCARSGIDMQKAIERVWQEVQARDWRKYPKNGVSE